MNYPIRTLQQLRPLLIGFRKHAGLSQANVAALLGITQQSYAKIEANPAVTSVERLFTILRLLGGEIVLGQTAVTEMDVPVGTVPALSSELATPGLVSASRKAVVTAPAKVTPASKKTEHWQHGAACGCPAVEYLAEW